MTEMNLEPPAITSASVPETELVKTSSPFRSWVYQFLILTFVLCGAFVGINMKLDLFGLNGNTNVRAHTLPRFSLYLMCRRFVPSNYDGLIIGSSVASSYDPSLITKYKVFNAAIRGSSLSEERVLTEEVLKHGRLKSVILVLNTRLTSTHEARSAYMTPHDYVASFGSVQTLMVDFQVLREMAGHGGPVTFDPNGKLRWPLEFRKTPFTPIPPEEFAIDPVEMKDLDTLLTELHAKQVKIYVVDAPVYLPRWEAQKAEFEEWRAKLVARLSPQDTFIDLNDGQLTEVTSVRGNFPDYSHLTEAASKQVVSSIAAQINR